MRITKRRRLARRIQPIGVDKRMALGRDNLDMLHPDASQFAGYKLGRFLYVRFVLFEGADTGNAEQIF